MCHSGLYMDLDPHPCYAAHGLLRFSLSDLLEETGSLKRYSCDPLEETGSLKRYQYDLLEGTRSPKEVSM